MHTTIIHKNAHQPRQHKNCLPISKLPHSIWLQISDDPDT